MSYNTNYRNDGEFAFGGRNVLINGTQYIVTGIDEQNDSSVSEVKNGDDKFAGSVAVKGAFKGSLTFKAEKNKPAPSVGMSFYIESDGSRAAVIPVYLTSVKPSRKEGAITEVPCDFIELAHEAPEMESEPAAAISVATGAKLTLTFGVRGSVCDYQWKKGGVAIADAVYETYIIPVAAAGDAGSYTCVATNLAGTVTSTAAVVTVTV